MEKFAMVIQIHKFKGNITISGNTMNDNRMHLKDVCIYYENINVKGGTEFQMSYVSDWTSMKKHKDISFDRPSEFLIPNQNSAY